MKSVPELSVALVCVPEVEASTLYGVADALAASGRLWQMFTGSTSTPSCLFNPMIVGRTTEPITTSFGYPVMAQAEFAHLPTVDVVYIPSLLIADAQIFAQENAEFIDWICAQYEAGAVIASACTGTLMLAATGLLDGQEATSHWAAASLLRQQYPNILLAEQRILSFAGPDQRLITAGGASSWQDLVLYLIMRYAGMETAREVSRMFLFQWHRDGQSPFAAMQRNTQHEDAVIGEVQLWLAKNYAEERALASAIERSELNERTFNRRFKAATGYTPIEYLQLLRLEEAKQMLEQEAEASISTIAEEVGYADEASFRRLFKRIVGLTPAQYRKKYLIPKFTKQVHTVKD